KHTELNYSKQNKRYSKIKGKKISILSTGPISGFRFHYQVGPAAFLVYTSF
ncbi:hypothetical protein ACJX0J_033009, partial [Zea mays]